MGAPDDRLTSEPDDLAEVFAEMARTLLDQTDVDAVLDRISTLAVETIRGARHCGVTVVDGRHVWTAAASDETPRQVDQIQYDTGEGPCLDAMRDHRIFTTGDIGTEHERWPSFSRRAVDETRIHSMLSFRLFGGTTLGALNLYSEDIDAFAPEDHHVGAVFAAHAAVALEGAQRVAHLNRALVSRDVISTAKGMLMAQSSISEDEAFDILRRASQRAQHQAAGGRSARRGARTALAGPDLSLGG